MAKELRTKIIEFLKKKGESTNFDISTELGVHIFEVDSVLDQMIKRREVIRLSNEGIGDPLVALNPNFKR